MMTKKLYLESIEAAYLEEFTAEVIAIERQQNCPRSNIVLPTWRRTKLGPWTINGPNGEMNVVEVRGRDAIHHTIEDTFELEIGDEVSGTIDFERRYAHMKMHTAQHLVSGIAYEMFDGVRTVGNQIHTEKSRIDFKPIQFTEDMLFELQSAVNEKIQLGLEVTDSK